MKIETIRITIDAEGQVVLEVDGIQGPACLALTDELIKDLGGATVSHELSLEYFEQQEAAEHQTAERHTTST